ncbi:MAG: hypothetical protein GC181_16195 [Bacteroidetes bacterium]|nr:hypothetical protein [Bacteroidota bacterium]
MRFFKKIALLNCFSFLIINSLVAQIPSNGMVAWWPFTGNAIDSATFLNNGTNHGATLTTDRFGNANHAYYFNGNAYIDCGEDPSLRTGSNTLNFWFIYSDKTNSMRMVDCSNSLSGEWGIAALAHPTNGIQYSVNAGSNDHTQGHATHAPLNDSTWHMFTGTFDKKSGVLSFYIDACYQGGVNVVGNKGGFTGSDTLVYRSGDHWTFGAHAQYFSSTPNNGPMYFKGALDDIRMYNRVLNSLEIHELFNEGVVIKETVYDTIRTHKTIYDTVWTYKTIYDTNYVNVYDTVRTYIAVTDTLYIDVDWDGNGPGDSDVLKIYPTPTNGDLTIELTDHLKATGAKIVLYNVIGQKILERDIDAKIMHIDLTAYDLAAGHYELVIFGKNGRELVTKRIVIY